MSFKFSDKQTTGPQGGANRLRWCLWRVGVQKSDRVPDPNVIVFLKEEIIGAVLLQTAPAEGINRRISPLVCPISRK